jgi:DNA-binding transcriptional ArsR family regulator
LKPHDQLKALADPTRLRIAFLLSRGELCVCDLTEVLHLPQPTISRHMAKLKSAEMVIDRRAGKWVHYQLAGDDFVIEITRTVGSHLATREPFQSDLSRLESYLIRKRCD